MKALQEQAEKLTLSSRAFYNDRFPIFAKRLTSMLSYDMVLPMNTGAEGVETALKLARKWGYEKKKIPKDKVNIGSLCPQPLDLERMLRLLYCINGLPI